MPLPSKQNSAGKGRFLVEARGILEVEAESGDAANWAAETWIQSVGRGEPSATLPPLRVRWLRIYPETDDLPGFERGQVNGDRG